MNGIILVKATH